MTERSSATAHVVVLDAMPLIHFGRADRLDVLRDLLVDKDCWTTQVVVEELRRGAAAHPELTEVDVGDWLAVAQLDTFDEIAIFATWAGRIGSGERDQGEASVLAGACRDGKLSEPTAGNLLDTLRTTGLRLPCTGAEFPSFAREHGLL
jgi:hypothetical protein